MNELNSQHLDEVNGGNIWVVAFIVDAVIDFAKGVVAGLDAANKE